MGVHTRYVQRTHCCESPVSWMDLGRYSSEERPAPSGAGPDIICRRSAFPPWTCDGFRSSVHSGVTGPQQNYGPATQIPPTGDDAISDSSWNVNYIKKQPGFCIEPIQPYKMWKQCGNFLEKQMPPECVQRHFWRYQAESNRCSRFCRPVPNHSAIVPKRECKDSSYSRICKNKIPYFFK